MDARLFIKKYRMKIYIIFRAQVHGCEDSWILHLPINYLSAQ